MFFRRLVTVRNVVGQGYVFTGVCDSVHRGGLSSMHWGDTPRQTPPGQTLPLGRHPPDGHCSERYASYWNAFLLVSVFSTAVVCICALSMVAIFYKNSNENAGIFVV